MSIKRSAYRCRRMAVVSVLFASAARLYLTGRDNRDSSRYHRHTASHIDRHRELIIAHNLRLYCVIGTLRSNDVILARRLRPFLWHTMLDYVTANDIACPIQYRQSPRHGTRSQCVYTRREHATSHGQLSVRTNLQTSSH